MHPADNAAREILANLEATYQPTHEYVRVRPEDFRHLDLGFYRRTASLLSAHGFKLLADLEDRTITNAPGTVLSPVLVRVLLSRDGTVTAALYHPHIRRFWMRALLWLLRKLPGRVTDMETECSDGSFVATSNASMAAALADAPMINAEYLPARTAPVEVYARHTQRLAEHLAARPGVTPNVLRTHDDVLASQNRMNALKAAYRGELGMVTREELERLSMVGRQTAHDVHDAIVREQQRRAG